jgi:hypothetical protein
MAGNDLKNYDLENPEHVNQLYHEQDANKYTSAQDLAGIDQVNASLPSQDAYSQSPSFSRDALNARASKSFGQNLNNLRMMSDFNVENQNQAQRMQNYDFSKKVQRIVKHVQEVRRVKAENEIAARNRVVGNVVSFVGAIGGAAIGGAPGAVAGAQLGRMVPGQGMKQASPYGRQGGGGGFGSYDTTNETSVLGGRKGTLSQRESIGSDGGGEE